MEKIRKVVEKLGLREGLQFSENYRPYMVNKGNDIFKLIDEGYYGELMDDRKAFQLSEISLFELKDKELFRERVLEATGFDGNASILMYEVEFHLYVGIESGKPYLHIQMECDLHSFDFIDRWKSEVEHNPEKYWKIKEKANLKTLFAEESGKEFLEEEGYKVMDKIDSYIDNLMGFEPYLEIAKQIGKGIESWSNFLVEK